MKDQVPRCPQCGEPAQVAVLLKARVRCVLQDDGTPGKVLSSTRESVITGYECSGRHEWPAEKEKA
jgi:hypothetical protein